MTSRNTALGAGNVAEIISDNAISVYLVRLKYWSGVAEQEARFTDAPVDLSVDVGSGLETWIGTGLLMNVANIAESADINEHGVDLNFDGVDQTIIAIILNNQFRGRYGEVYKAWYDPSTGAVADTPYLIFTGYQNEPYSIGESSTDNADAVSISTRLISRLSKTTTENPILSNPTSHKNMLDRGGIHQTTANFWVHVPVIVNVEVFWGEKDPPAPYDPGLPYDPNRENPWVKGGY